MSITVIKAGISDTFQDEGRFGFQQLGINPGGVMDPYAMRIANALTGSNPNEAVLEMCFPASTLHFDTSAIIALSGADFQAKLNDRPIPMNRAICVPANTELRFSKCVHGSYSYLAVYGGFQIEPWHESYSTNLKAKVGGIDGRVFRKGDSISLQKALQPVDGISILPWQANVSEFYSEPTLIRCIRGHEWDWLAQASQSDFKKQEFIITAHRDRMGYRLGGPKLEQKEKHELLTTAVDFGTVQLLPSGELIVLMADHQTTGGYPRVAHVISADLSKLTQCRVDERISFHFVGLDEAEHIKQQHALSLRQLESSAGLRLLEFITQKL